MESGRRLEEQVEGLRGRLGKAARYQLLRARQQLTELAQHRTFARMQDGIARRQQRVDEMVTRLVAAQGEKLGRYRRRLELAAARLRHQELRQRLAAVHREVEARVAAATSAMRTRLLRQRARLEQSSARLQALSPLHILERGYALVFDAAGNLVKDAAQVKAGDAILARVSRGEIAATVKKARRS